MLIQSQSIHTLLSERVELLQEQPGAVVDVDAEIDRLLTVLPPEVAAVRDDLRLELAQLAADRGLAILLARTGV